MLTVTDVSRGRIVAEEHVEPGALLRMAYIHSTEGRPVRATLTISGHAAAKACRSRARKEGMVNSSS